MSYILDALRKADSERERGEVPGLHAHPVMPTSDDTPGSQVNQKLLLAVGVLTALLLLIVVWLMWGHGASQPDRPAMPPDQAGLGAAPPGAMPSPPQPGGVAMAPAIAPAVAQTAPPPTQPMTGTQSPGLYPPVPTQQPATETPPAATPKTTLPGMSAEAAANAASRKTTATASPKPATEDTKVYRLMDLPDAVRRELPTLTIGGAMYSDTPANRMLIINSQVLHEGDKITADLTLEEIKLKSAVFRFRNYRYLVSY